MPPPPVLLSHTCGLLLSAMMDLAIVSWEPLAKTPPPLPLALPISQTPHTVDGLAWLPESLDASMVSSELVA